MFNIEIHVLRSIYAFGVMMMMYIQWSIRAFVRSVYAFSVMRYIVKEKPEDRRMVGWFAMAVCDSGFKLHGRFSEMVNGKGGNR